MENLKSKILQTAAPPITSFPLIANMLSILWLDKEKTLPWICDRFIQLVARNDIQFNFPLGGNFYEYEVCSDLPIFIVCPYLKQSRFERMIIDKFSPTLTDFIRFCIDNDYYLHLCLDPYHISSSQNYNKRHFNHPTFIYGYDEEKIYLKDFYSSGYKEYSAGYEEINTAYVSVLNNEFETRKYYGMVSMFKYRPVEYPFSIDKVIEDYIDYLNCTDRHHMYRDDVSYGRIDGYLYGLDYYNALAYKIENCLYDVRPFHVLYDHKVLQEIRVRYMIENELINGGEEILSECVELKKLVQKLRNTFLKEIVAESQKPNIKLAELCLEIKQKDNLLVKKLLERIKEN